MTAFEISQASVRNFYSEISGTGVSPVEISTCSFFCAQEEISTASAPGGPENANRNVLAREIDADRQVRESSPETVSATSNVPGRGIQGIYKEVE